jgi:hypothetical protein
MRQVLSSLIAIKGKSFSHEESFEISVTLTHMVKRRIRIQCSLGQFDAFDKFDRDFQTFFMKAIFSFSPLGVLFFLILIYFQKTFA